MKGYKRKTSQSYRRFAAIAPWGASEVPLCGICQKPVCDIRVYAGQDALQIDLIRLHAGGTQRMLPVRERQVRKWYGAHYKVNEMGVVTYGWNRIPCSGGGACVR